MSIKECPKCGLMMEQIEEDPDTGIVGGWVCDCGESYPNDAYDDDLTFLPLSTRYV